MRTYSERHGRSPKRLYRLGLVVLALTGTVAGGVAVGADNSNDDSASSAPLPQMTAVTTQVSDQELDAFGVLRRSVGAGDAVSATTAVQVEDTLAVKLHGMNVTLARRASTDAGAVWIAPGNGDTCILASDAASRTGATPPEVGVAACLADADAATGRLVASLARADQKGVHGIVAGLVPDGVESVEIHFSDGSTGVSKVQDNVYVTELDGPTVASVTFSGPSGAADVRLSD